jgi:hypothetical protein
MTVKVAVSCKPVYIHCLFAFTYCQDFSLITISVVLFDQMLSIFSLHFTWPTSFHMRTNHCLVIVWHYFLMVRELAGRLNDGMCHNSGGRGSNRLCGCFPSGIVLSSDPFFFWGRAPASSSIIEAWPQDQNYCRTTTRLICLFVDDMLRINLSLRLSVGPYILSCRDTMMLLWIFAYFV